MYNTMLIKNHVNKNIDYAIEKIKEKLLIKHPENNAKSSKANINIACILDIFSYECFKYEATFFQLGTQNWKEIMIDKKPKLLFVESAWQGFNQEWINKIADIHISKDKTLFFVYDILKVP